MGLLDRFRPAAVERWRPPANGLCHCESHVDDLLEEMVPLADGSGSVQVAMLAISGTLTAVPTPDYLYLPGLLPNERRGPFHWRVLPHGGLDRFLDPAAEIRFDDAVYVQPGVDSVLWLSDHTVLAIGASRLCARGVQGALVRALMNPRLRPALAA